MHLVDSGPPQQMPEEKLMQHFFYGLKPESAHFMNVAFKGSVMYKTVAEEVKTIEKMKKCM